VGSSGVKESQKTRGWCALLPLVLLVGLFISACSQQIQCDPQSPGFADCERGKEQLRQAEAEASAAVDRQVQEWSEQAQDAAREQAQQAADAVVASVAAAMARTIEELSSALSLWLQSLTESLPLVGSRPDNPPKSGTPLRVAILLPGINTESASEFRGDQSASLGQVHKYLNGNRGYDDVIFFSYNCGAASPNSGHPKWTPANYVYTDTFQALDTSARELECLISAYRNATDRPVHFDLVGHSLGGAVAFRYLKNGGGGIHHLVTLDSPVNGIDTYTASIWDDIETRYGLARFLPFVSNHDKEELSRAIQMFNSTVAKELKQQGEDPLAAAEATSDDARAIMRAGTKVYTYVNQRDEVVSALAAGISGFGRDFNRGKSLEYIIWVHNVEGWLNTALENHRLITQILDSDQVASEERAALCKDLEIKC
jgi:pimeloyl-ACP methyl ester carboxylesterase